MNGPRQSDRPVVPAKSPNKDGASAAEGMEGRGLAKGSPSQQNGPWILGRDGALSALERVREAAERDKEVRFTALLHHVYNVEHLRGAYYGPKRDATPGVDGETWEHYGQALEENLADLSGRLERGAYRAKPVRRAYIPKADGRQRPLGIPTLEDKLVQRTTVAVSNAIYETDFLGFSYGFRRGRSPDHALDALTAGLATKAMSPRPEGVGLARQAVATPRLPRRPALERQCRMASGCSRRHWCRAFDARSRRQWSRR